MEDMNKFQHWSEYAKTYLGDQFWNEIMASIQPYASSFPGGTNTGMNGAPGVQKVNGPRVDLFRTEQELIACIEVPGIEHVNAIDLQIDGQTLSISGFIRKKYPEDAAIFQERTTGHFDRTVQLPVPIRKEAVIAKYAHGLLEIRMPIAGQNKRNKIRIDY